MTKKREKARNSFVLCVHNDGSEELATRKVYQVLPHREAEREGYLRVVDESGDDYLYPAEYFVSVRLPASVLDDSVDPQRGREGAPWTREHVQRIDLHWHDLRHEGACRLADGVDIGILQRKLGHASIQQTQRYLNVTDEELRRGLEVTWNNKGRPLRAVSASA